MQQLFIFHQTLQESRGGQVGGAHLWPEAVARGNRPHGDSLDLVPRCLVLSLSLCAVTPGGCRQGAGALGQSHAPFLPLQLVPR